MEITFLMLTYFQKIAQLQHLTSAAEALHVSQPALSKTLASLEQGLGTKLFDRTGRNISLNRDGEIFLHYTDRILANMADAKRALSDSKRKQQQTVTLALHVASALIPELLTEFKKLHPDVNFHILQKSSSAAAPASEQQADLTLFSNIYPTENDHTATLLREDLLLAMPERMSRMYASPIHLRDLNNAEFISLQRGESLRTITDAYFQMAGIAPQIVLESDSPQTVRAFVRAGVGVALVPSITWSDVRGDQISLHPIATPHCQRFISLSWHKDRYCPPVVTELRDYLIRQFAPFAKKRSETLAALEPVFPEAPEQVPSVSGDSEPQ